jgi:hypothetical protein
MTDSHTLNPAALTIPMLAQLLSLASRKPATVAMTEDNLHAEELKHVGVTIDPVHDSAWLTRKQLQ